MYVELSALTSILDQADLPGGSQEIRTKLTGSLTQRNIAENTHVGSREERWIEEAKISEIAKEIHCSVASSILSAKA